LGNPSRRNDARKEKGKKGVVRANVQILMFYLPGGFFVLD
jgi:hypothetical protein